MTRTLLVNLYGGPGSGKSTLAAQIFAALKGEGVVAELVGERAKELVWEQAAAPFDQLELFVEQRRRILRLVGRVDVAVSDSPLMQGAAFAVVVAAGSPAEVANHPGFVGLVEWTHRTICDSLNLFADRGKAYETRGRSESETQARQCDGLIDGLLGEWKVVHDHVDPADLPYIMEAIRDARRALAVADTMGIGPFTLDDYVRAVQRGLHG